MDHFFLGEREGGNSTTGIYIYIFEWNQVTSLLKKVVEQSHLSEMALFQIGNILCLIEFDFRAAG